MGRILVMVLALAAVALLAYYQVRGDGAKSAPKQTLDNVHKSADRVEAELKQKAEEMEKKVNQAE